MPLNSNVNKSCGRLDEHVRNDLLKCGLLSKESHFFETQQHSAMVFTGSLLRISMMRSMGSVSDFSPTYVENFLDDRVWRLTILRCFAGLLFISMFMAIFAVVRLHLGQLKVIYYRLRKTYPNILHYLFKIFSFLFFLIWNCKSPIVSFIFQPFMNQNLSSYGNKYSF